MRRRYAGPSTQGDMPVLGPVFVLALVLLTLLCGAILWWTFA